MAVYGIVLKGDGVLREKAKEVPRITPNIIKLLDNMRDTMYANKGVGLAAPQIGVSKRVIVVDVGEGLYEVINPEVLDRRGEMLNVFLGFLEDVESDLSVSDGMDCISTDGGSALFREG